MSALARLGEVPVAHLGNVPVEEWLPFLVPVIALFLYGRREDRRRRARMARLADVSVGLDEATVERIVAAWAGSGHAELSREHLPLLYPPGPDGKSTAELAARTHSNSATVERLLDDLADLGYVDFDGGDGHDRRAWLTADGYALTNVTEDVILAAGDGAEREDAPQ